MPCPGPRHGLNEDSILIRKFSYHAVITGVVRTIDHRVISPSGRSRRFFLLDCVLGVEATERLVGRQPQLACAGSLPTLRALSVLTVKTLRSNSLWIAKKVAALYYIAIFFVLRTILFVLRTTSL